MLAHHTVAGNSTAACSYRTTCKRTNVTPLRADLLIAEIYEDVFNTMLLKNKLPAIALTAFLPETMNAPAGR